MLRIEKQILLLGLVTFHGDVSICVGSIEILPGYRQLDLANAIVGVSLVERNMLI